MVNVVASLSSWGSSWSAWSKCQRCPSDARATFIKWTGWTLAVAVQWWQQHKHCCLYSSCCCYYLLLCRVSEHACDGCTTAASATRLCTPTRSVCLSVCPLVCLSVCWPSLMLLISIPIYWLIVFVLCCWTTVSAGMSVRLRSHRHQCESKYSYIRFQETWVCMYFNGSRSHWNEFCTSTGYLWISLVRAVSAQVVLFIQPVWSEQHKICINLTYTGHDA